MDILKQIAEALKQYEADPRFNAGQNRCNDAHRRHAYASIDVKLEMGVITPKQAAQLKRKWDRRHGY